MFVAVMYNGVIHKIPRDEFEPLDVAYKRAWFIAKSDDPNMTMREKLCRSHMHVNEKYNKMKYKET